MWFIYVLSYVALVFQFCFVSLAIASGLYYLAEVIEEFTSTAAKVIRTIILVLKHYINYYKDLIIVYYLTEQSFIPICFKIVIGIYIGFLLFEDFPLLMTLCGLATQFAHLLLMNTFPYFMVSSPGFILTVIFLIVNHYLAFSYFSTHFYPFLEVYIVLETKSTFYYSTFVIIINFVYFFVTGNGILHSVLVVSAICIFRFIISK